MCGWLGSGDSRSQVVLLLIVWSVHCLLLPNFRPRFSFLVLPAGRFSPSHACPCAVRSTHTAAWPGSTSAGGDSGHTPKNKLSCSSRLLLRTPHVHRASRGWAVGHTVSQDLHTPPSSQSSFTLFLNFPPGLPKTKRRSCRGLTTPPHVIQRERGCRADQRALDNIGEIAVNLRKIIRCKNMQTFYFAIWLHHFLRGDCSVLCVCDAYSVDEIPYYAYIHELF